MSKFDERRLLGAFREAIFAELTPVVQMKFTYNLHADIMTTTLTGSGAAIYEDATAKLSTTAATNSSALLRSKDTGVYQPGQGMLFRGTAIFSPPAAGSQQYIGVGSDTEGYFIGYNGTEFGVMRKHEGTETWTSLPNVADGSSEWIGSLDLTKGNVFQIQYQWLGFGSITYSVFNPDEQKYDVLYIDKYPNKHVDPSSHNPSFSAELFVANTTNDTNLVVYSSSMAVFIEGQATKLTYRKGVTSSKTITTETNILTIRSRSTFESITNQGLIFPDLFSLAADGTKTCKFRIYIDATLGGSPSYTNISTNRSIVEYDTAGTTVSNGTLIAAIVIDKAGSQLVDLGRKLRIHPGDTLTVSAESASSSIADVGISWEELL